MAFRPTKKPMSKAEKAAAALAAAAQASIKEAVADSESPRKIRPMKRPSGQSGSPAPRELFICCSLCCMRVFPRLTVFTIPFRDVPLFSAALVFSHYFATNGMF